MGSLTCVQHFLTLHALNCISRAYSKGHNVLAHLSAKNKISSGVYIELTLVKKYFYCNFVEFDSDTCQIKIVLVNTIGFGNVSDCYVVVRLLAKLKLF